MTHGVMGCTEIAFLRVVLKMPAAEAETSADKS